MNKIEKIILNAVDITRWADKGFIYPFLEEEERQERLQKKSINVE